MKTIKNTKAVEKLNPHELFAVRGGEERDYIIVTVRGKPTKVYL